MSRRHIQQTLFARLLNAGGAVEVSSESAEEAVPAELLQDGEIVILSTKPSLLFVVLGSLASLTIIAIATLALVWMAGFAWAPFDETLIFALGVAAASARLIWQAVRWIMRLYVLTDRRLICRGGVIRLRLFETPLSNIQHTGVFTRTRERLFGLGTVGFATSGSDSFDCFWEMLRRPFETHSIITEAIRRYGRRP